MQNEFESEAQREPASGRSAYEKAQKSGAQARASAGELRDEARRAAGDVQNEIASAAQSVREQAGEVADSLKHRARAMADEQKAAGAEQISGFARAISLAADELQNEMPQAAGYVREAAAKVDNVSAMIRERSIEDLMREANGFARANPFAVFGMSLVAGFALSRFLKSAAPAAPHGHTPAHGLAEERREASPAYPPPHPSSEAVSEPPERLAAFPSSQF